MWLASSKFNSSFVAFHLSRTFPRTIELQLTDWQTCEYIYVFTANRSIFFSEFKIKPIKYYCNFCNEKKKIELKRVGDLKHNVNRVNTRRWSTINWGVSSHTMLVINHLCVQPITNNNYSHSAVTQVIVFSRSPTYIHTQRKNQSNSIINYVCDVPNRSFMILFIFSFWKISENHWRQRIK